jgi:hypothetical protein
MILEVSAGSAGLFEIGSGVVALGIAAAGVTFGLQAANSATGLIEGQPAGTAFMFAAVAMLAAITAARTGRSPETSPTLAVLHRVRRESVDLVALFHPERRQRRGDAVHRGAAVVQGRKP